MHRAKTPTKLQSSASRKPTPSRILGVVTPTKRSSDENAKPSTTGKSTVNTRTPPSSRPFSRFKTHTPSSSKAQDDAASTASSSSESGRKTPSRTPLSSTTRLNANRSSAKTPPRVTPNRTPNRTPTKSHTFQSEEHGRSIIIEFNDDIFVTPRQPPTPGSVSVTSSSVIRIQDSPMRTKAGSPLNRSLSASSLYPSEVMRPKMKRSRSEAKLSSEDGSSSEAQSLAEGESSRLKVSVRIRPLQPREHGNAIAVAGRDISISSDLGAVHVFTFDHCFPSTGPEAASQEDVYETLVRPLVDTAFEGYNACLFAYGQTGSGKTYSMMGPDKGISGVTSESGIIPRFCQEMLARASAIDETDVAGSNKPAVTSTVEISYLEVYNEKIRDLLVPGSNQLKVREHQVYGPYVENLSKHVVNSWNEFQLWLDIGNKKRATATTEMNEQSSRSHSLFTVVLTQTFTYTGREDSWKHDQTRRSQINLVDLAGSERMSHFSVTSDRLREGVSINRSLLTLGKVISALVDRRGFVPYRDSVLTWLLKESLGGNSRTTMLATVSPCSSHIDETLATLRYASQARSIVNTVRVNEAPQDRLIRELKAEVERLKTIEVERAQPVPPPSSLPHLDHEETRHLKHELNAVRVELESSRKSESELTAQVNELRHRISSLESVNVAKDLKLKEYSETNKGLAAKVEELKSEKSSLKAEHLALNAQFLEAQDRLDQSEKKLKSKLEGFAKLEKTVMSLQDDVNSLKRKNCVLDASNEKLRRGLEEKEALIKELEEQLRASQDQLNASMATFILKEEFCNAQVALESDVKAKQEEVNQLREQLKDSSAHLTMLRKESEDKIATFQDNVASLIKEVEQLQFQLGQSREEIISKNQQLEEATRLKSEAQKKLQDKEHELVKLGNEVKYLEVQLAKANESSAKMKQTRFNESELRKYKVENEIKQKRICTLEEKLDESERVLEPLRRLHSSLRSLFDEDSDIDDTAVLQLREKLFKYEKRIELGEKEIDQIRGENDALRTQSVKLEADLEARNHEIKMKELEWADSMAKMRSLAEEEKSLQREVGNELTKVLKSLEEEKIEKRQMEDKWRNKVQKLNAKLQSEKNKNTEMNRLLQTYETEKTQLESRLKQERVTIASLQKNLEEANETLAVTNESRQAAIDSVEESSKCLMKKLQGAEELMDRLNQMSGEQSALNAQLRMSLGRNPEVEEKEDEIRRLKEHIEEMKGKAVRLNARIASLEHELDVKRINEESIEANLKEKIQQLNNLQREMTSSHEWNNKLMEEKLVLVKVMEKHCAENDSSANQRIVRENESLKKDLKICEQRLDKKSTKIDNLEKKVVSLRKKLDDFHEFVKRVVENKIDYEDEKAFIKASLARKEEETYEFIMNLGFPHHFEVTVRKARNLSEELKIPYEIEIIEGTKSVRFKHLDLSAVATLSHYRLNDWVQQIEKNKSWNKSADIDLPWRVNFDQEPHPLDDIDFEVVKKHNWEALGDCSGSPSESEAAAPTNVHSTDTSNPCPIAWRKTIIKRHLQGIVDDAKVLRQYFQGTEGSRIYSILSRIISGVERLEEEAKKKRKSFFNCDTEEA